MGGFAPTRAKEQWKLYKKNMLKKIFGRIGFREYLTDYEGSWTPDSGPVVAGIGVAATGLGLNAASTVAHRRTFNKLEKTMNPFYSTLSIGDLLPGINIFSRLGTDLLSSSIWLNGSNLSKKSATRELSPSATMLPASRASLNMI